MPLPRATVDELLQTIKRSQMSTLLVEGVTDSGVYRLLERRFGLSAGTVLPCGGRETLLRMFERREEVGGAKCAFLADRDMWLFNMVPPEYDGVIFTAGYSIENDVLDGPAVERLLAEEEAAGYSQLLDALSTWFAFEVGEYLSGREYVVDIHISRLCPPPALVLSEEWIQRRSYVEPSAALISRIRQRYRLELRGKQVTEALLRFLSAATRRSKYSRENLLEIAASSNDHQSLRQLAEAVQRALVGRT